MEQTQADKVQEITDKLEQGIKDLFDSEKYMNYLKVMSKFHNYSFNNSLLIAMQKPDATFVAGYTSWQANFHRNVNKGEHGIKILAPSPYRINKDVEKIDPDTQQPILGKNGEPLKERVQVTIPAYKLAYVYDISQTSGEELPEISKELSGDIKEYERFFEAIRKAAPVPIEICSIMTGANGFYHLDEKKIAIREGMSHSQTVKTAIHETAHAKLHDKDNGVEKDNLPDRRTKEVEAESIAYTVCQHFGIDTSEYSFGYVAGWSSGKSLDELKSSMNTIRTTASKIIRDIEKELVLIEQEEKITQLAHKIDDFVKEYDPYEYADQVEDREANVERIKADLKAGNTDHYQKWFKPIIEDEEQIEMRDKATNISEQIKGFSKVKSVQDISKTIGEEKTMDVVKTHHRSRR